MNGATGERRRRTQRCLSTGQDCHKFGKKWKTFLQRSEFVDFAVEIESVDIFELKEKITTNVKKMMTHYSRMKKDSLALGVVICITAMQAMASESDMVVAPDAKVIASPGAETTSLISRIRIFGQNNAKASLFKGMDCVKSAWSSDAILVSGRVGSAFGSLFGAVSNSSLGIAETETTKYLSRRDGIFSKAYFREYEIPAGKPTSLRLGFQNPSSFYKANGFIHAHNGSGCNGAISFIPKAGEDYEVGFTMNDRECVLSVNRVVKKDDVADLVPVPVTVAPQCPAN